MRVVYFKNNVTTHVEHKIFIVYYFSFSKQTPNKLRAFSVIYDRNLGLFIFVGLKKTFHREKYFSPNFIPLRQQFDFILSFKIYRYLLEYLVY